MKTRAAMVVLVCAPVLLAGGCQSGATEPRTSMYEPDDLLAADASLREQLASSSWLAGRMAGTQPAIALLPDEVANRSNERLPDGEAWAMVARVILEPSMQGFLRDRNVQVYMPPERLPGIRRAGLDAPEGFSQSATHFLRAVFRSATRVAAVSGQGVSDLRTDTFLIDLTALERASGRAVWTGTYEFKRYARGTVAD